MECSNLKQPGGYVVCFQLMRVYGPLKDETYSAFKKYVMHGDGQRMLESYMGAFNKMVNG